MTSLKKCGYNGLKLLFPVSGINYTNDAIPQHPNLSILANCEQKLTRGYARRCIVMEKISEPKKPKLAFVVKKMYEVNNFRDKDKSTVEMI